MDPTTALEPKISNHRAHQQPNKHAVYVHGGVLEKGIRNIVVRHAVFLQSDAATTSLLIFVRLLFEGGYLRAALISSESRQASRMATNERYSDDR